MKTGRVRRGAMALPEFVQTDLPSTGIQGGMKVSSTRSLDTSLHARAELARGSGEGQGIGLEAVVASTAAVPLVMTIRAGRGGSGGNDSQKSKSKFQHCESEKEGIKDQILPNKSLFSVSESN